MPASVRNKKFDPTNDTDGWNVESSHVVSYHVGICRGILEPSNDRLARWCMSETATADQVLVVLDDSVNRIYRGDIAHYFDHWKLDASYLVLPGGEDTKELGAAVQIAEKIGETGLLRRSEKVVVFAGGVLMDVVGMAANLFRRGVPYIRVPTTLLGQVDAGVGVKTGVNYGDHKNRLGTFYAPACSLIDPTFLASLPPRHIANGLAEITKMSLVKDARLFSVLESTVGDMTGRDFAEFSPRHEEIMIRAVVGMLDELEPNLHEADLERIVDFGHTFSPSLELIADPPLLHGEAVAIDMAICVALSMGRGLIDQPTALRAVTLLSDLDLPISNPMFTPDLLHKALEDTVKHRDGQQRLPLMTAIGSAEFFNDVTAFELHQAVRIVRQLEEAIPRRASVDEPERAANA